MKQFVIEARQRNVLFGLMALGVICLIISFVSDPINDGHHLRFWTNLLQNVTFFTGIAFTATFVTAATITVYAGWHTAFKRVWEAMSLFLIIGLVGILIVGVAGKMGIHNIYHWMDTANPDVANDKILQGKAGFLNFTFYLVAIFGFGGTWYWFARKFRALSMEQDSANADPTYPYYKKLKFFGAMFMPIAGFTSAAAIWLWMMSIDPHWYSTMYAWYTTASWWVSCVAITILLLIYLKSKGYYQEVTTEHLHDLGKFLFAFSVFWTYLWFSQYMLIWYANIGEETIYFRQRMGEFPVLFYGNIIMNFVLPFLILIRNDTKRKMGSLGFVAVLVLIGHWWDFFQMIKIGPYKTALEHAAAGHADGGVAHGGHEAAGHAVAQAGHEAAQAAGHAIEGGGHEVVKAAMSATEELQAINDANFFHYTPDMTIGYGIPGLPELGIFLGFCALFCYFIFLQLEKAALVPKNDPYLEETLHHQVEMHEAH